MKLLTGVEAEKTSQTILNNLISKEPLKYGEPFVAGYFKEGDIWVAFDNTDGNMWVDDYETEELARESL